jgi:hypothetical protein
MATVKRTSLSENQTTWNAYFNLLGCSLVTIANDVIMIDGIFSIIKESYAISIYKGDTQLVRRTCNNPNILTIGYTDSFIYFNTTDPQNRRVLFVYEKFNDLRLYAATSTTDGSPFIPIESLTLTDISTLQEYKHSAILNYQTVSKYIDYSVDRLFSGTMCTDVVDPYFITCSPVTSDRLVTFNGENYYSAGTTTLIPMGD